MPEALGHGASGRGPNEDQEGDMRYELLWWDEEDQEFRVAYARHRPVAVMMRLVVENMGGVEGVVLTEISEEEARLSAEVGEERP